MFVDFEASSYDPRKFGPLIWEPLHYIKYHVNSNLKVIATDAVIPGLLKSRTVRLLLTKKADKFRIKDMPPLSGYELEPLAEDPRDILREFQELWHGLGSSQASPTGRGLISSTDMLKWQLARIGGSLLAGRKFELEVAQHLSVGISNSLIKSLLETVLGIDGEANLKVFEGRIIYYPLAVCLEEKRPVRDALNHFRVDAVYSHYVAAETVVRRRFQDALPSQRVSV